MGVFFAHKMYDTLKVPIGMIMVASSGSPVSQLMSAEASKATGYTPFENDIPFSGMYNRGRMTYRSLRDRYVTG